MTVNSKKGVMHIDCIHKKYLSNQGIVMCDIGDPSKCDTCEHKTPKDVEYESTWTSTEDVEYEDFK